MYNRIVCLLLQMKLTMYDLIIVQVHMSLKWMDHSFKLEREHNRSSMAPTDHCTICDSESISNDTVGSSQYRTRLIRRVTPC